MPQKLGFVKHGDDGIFTWGWDLEKVLKSGHKSDDEIVVLEWLKMCLHAPGENSGLECSIKEQLTAIAVSGKGVRWLLELHLRHIRAAVWEASRRDCRKHNAKQLSHMFEKNYIAVPEINNPNACRFMINAARNAGFPTAQTVSEKEAAGAWAAHKLMKNLQGDEGGAL